MPIEVGPAVATIYVLDDLDQRAQALQVVDSPRIWRMKTRLDDFRRRVKVIATEHAAWLAHAFRDYMALACAGEARHARGAGDRYWLNYPQHGSDRAAAYAAARRYNPAHILEAAVKVFDGHWSPSYGGQKWKRIAEAGTLYGKIPDVAFLDHAVDLSHNGGLYLDKGVVFHMTNIDTYRRMLDRKTQIGLLEPYEDSDTTSVRVHKDVADLVREGREIGLHTARVVGVPAPDWQEALIVWGMEAFEPKLIVRGSDEERKLLEQEYQEHEKKVAELQKKQQEAYLAMKAKQEAEYAAYLKNLDSKKLVFTAGNGDMLVFEQPAMPLIIEDESEDVDEQEDEEQEENPYAGLLQHHGPGNGKAKLEHYSEGQQGDGLKRQKQPASQEVLV